METLAEKVNRYEQIVKNLLTRWAAIPNLEPDVRDRLLFDETNQRYAVISEGWNGRARIHHIILDLEINNGKVWILADNTDVVIAHELESQGIPKSDIVLGFRAPSVRAETEYAVA
jgi:XisI protein